MPRNIAKATRETNMEVCNIENRRQTDKRDVVHICLWVSMYSKSLREYESMIPILRRKLGENINQALEQIYFILTTIKKDVCRATQPPCHIIFEHMFAINYLQLSLFWKMQPLFGWPFNFHNIVNLRDNLARNR